MKWTVWKRCRRHDGTHGFDTRAHDRREVRSELAARWSRISSTISCGSLGTVTISVFTGVTRRNRRDSYSVNQNTWPDCKNHGWKGRGMHASGPNTTVKAARCMLRSCPNTITLSGAKPPHPIITPSSARQILYASQSQEVVSFLWACLSKVKQ